MNKSEDQKKYFDTQNILNIDFDLLYNDFIKSVDLLRSHFNAIALNSSELNTPGYQESRCHAYYRMMGFPIVSNATDFYSPGFDPNLNTESESLEKYKNISKSISNNKLLTDQFLYREQIPKDFSQIFGSGGLKASAAAFGSIFIRSFEHQIGSTDPLVNDINKTQTVNARDQEIIKIFKDSSLTFKTKHQLKPFIVDPRIDEAIKPINNRMAAPFLIDKSQLQIYDGDGGQLKRPYIERVISVRFNNKNLTQDNDVLKTIQNDILNDLNIKNTDLINLTSNALKSLHNSDIIIFDNYIKLIKALVLKLSKSINNIENIRHVINFKPVPDPKNGPETGTPGNKINNIDFNDADNKEIEQSIKTQTYLKYQYDTNSTLDTGLNGSVDLGDFVFSNIDDHLPGSNKSVTSSYEDQITKQSNKRNRLGKTAIDDMAIIEIIMGEFSGIGVIDMIAIQAAFWIMDPGKLLGLIDDRAYNRLQTSRPNINISGSSRSGVIDGLQEFEKQLKYIYLLIQKYLDSINDGTAFKPS